MSNPAMQTCGFLKSTPTAMYVASLLAVTRTAESHLKHLNQIVGQCLKQLGKEKQILDSHTRRQAQTKHRNRGWNSKWQVDSDGISNSGHIAGLGNRACGRVWTAQSAKRLMVLASTPWVEAVSESSLQRKSKYFANPVQLEIFWNNPLRMFKDV